ncbi:glycoside hydrolase family 30 protein [Diplogelasinospora grovesii]|uniref:Glycoside hydrolase family 30 protein n=1 Tax=Diplogelasinospora grovesii TaxID=303347 RepID=A0AAN6N826_9PEZI|nr:glycoside hydrolase family 30 protein [Diplogelasinospora grovesii]
MYSPTLLLGQLAVIAGATAAAQPSPVTIRAGGPDVSIAIDNEIRYQAIDGFGFCEAFQRAHALINLPAPYRDEVIDLLFNPDTGAGFSILRIGLGSSPNSTLDHMNSPQPSAHSPFVWDHNDSGQLWVARQALRYGVRTFYADAWSAPGYMKTNGRDDQGGWLCGVRGEGVASTINGTTSACGGASWVEAYAEYLVRYVQSYLSEGIPIKFVGFLNEPNAIKGYATMQSDGYQAADEAFALSLALRASNLSVGISCCEGQGWSYARQLLSEMQDAGAEDTLSLITAHAYKGAPAAPDSPLNTTLPVWITENSPIMQRLGMSQTWYNNGSENEGLYWAVTIHNALTAGNVSAYIYWIGSEPYQVGGNFYVTDPPYQIGGNFWATSHFSRFIRPGATRIGTTTASTASKNDSSSVMVSAYENKDGSVVVQVINNCDQSVTAAVTAPNWVHTPTAWEACEVDTRMTDNTHNLTLADAIYLPADGNLDTVFPPRSLTTLFVKCSGEN